jgi:hypothetical protein
MATAIGEIQKCAELLASVGETFWSDKLKKFVGSTGDQLDVSRVEEVLSWYGSMGSFSDVYISSMNDHAVSEDDEDRLNTELAKLRTSIYELASEIKRHSR